jgi:adenosylcobinamide-GDP ribazoletransferase
MNRLSSRAQIRLVAEELVGAVMVLTRLPIGGLSRPAIEPSACVWAYPLVGIFIGAVGGAVFSVGSFLTLPPLISAICAVAAMVMATGGLHEDGLADTADGLGGGRSRERKLDIMRDSRIGSFGALALILSVTLRVAAASTLAQPAPVITALIVAAVAGRGAMILPLLALQPARNDGLAAPLAATSRSRLWIGLLLTTFVALLPHGLPAWLAAAAAGCFVAWLARRQIGGYTGDILGAVEQVAECAAMTACVSRLS